MAQCNGNRYMSLCSIPKPVSRDGYAGPTAHIYLPFCGFHFFSGAQYTFPNATVAQNSNFGIGGGSVSSAFHKEGAWCGGVI